MRMFPDGFKALSDGWSKGFVSGAANTPRKALVLISAWLSGLITSTFALLFLPLASQQPQIGIGVLYLSFAVQCGVLFRTVGSFVWWSALFFPITLCFYLGLFSALPEEPKRGGSIQWKGPRCWLNFSALWIVVLNVVMIPVIHFSISWWFTKMPATRFDSDSFFYQERRWERGGRFIEASFEFKLGRNGFQTLLRGFLGFQEKPGKR